MNTTQLHLQALWFDVIAPWLACKARAKYTCTKRGDKCTHAWVLDLESSNFRGYAYKISREDEHICCVLYWPPSPDWYISPWYFVTKLCSSQPHRSPSSYMVSHRGILFCLQRKEQGHCMRLYFFLKFQGIPVTSMQAQELEEVRGTIIGVEYTKLYFLWWVRCDAESIFYCSIPSIGLHAWVCYLL